MVAPEMPMRCSVAPQCSVMVLFRYSASDTFGTLSTSNYRIGFDFRHAPLALPIVTMDLIGS